MPKVDTSSTLAAAPEQDEHEERLTEPGNEKADPCT